jgi:hypothetical protein
LRTDGEFFNAVIERILQIHGNHGGEQWRKL